jgi:long-chain acyl-CoA synthetase
MAASRSREERERTKMDPRPWHASYPKGVPTTLDLPEKSLYALLHETATRHPDRPAMTFVIPGAPRWKTLSYAELARQVDQFSRVLVSLGIGKGDRVGLILPNCPQYVIAYYACQRIGAVVVGNNPLYTERELSHQLEDAQVEVVVVMDVLYPKLAAVREEVGVRDVIVAKVTDFMAFPVNLLAPRTMKKHALAAGEAWPPVPDGAPVKWWAPLMKRTYPQIAPAAVDAKGDVAGLIYTGGTTGLSKGAMLTHHNLVSNVLQGRSWFPDLVDGQEGIMCVIPFFHSYGMTVAMNLGVLIGAKLVLQVQPDIETTLKAIAKEKPTLFPGVPRLYIAINEDPRTPSYELHSVKACLSGAAPLPKAVAEKFEGLTGAKVVEGYGLTETSPITHANPLDGRARYGTIGLPIPETDCRIVDLDDWTKEVAHGERGELIISGPQIMKGYWNRPDETAGMIREASDGTRWLLSGDIAVMDDDGFFSIVDRKKEMILVSGFNVYPTELEAVLYRNPKVMKACVIGLPDEKTGEQIKAYIVLREGMTATEAEILEFLRDPEFGLTGYKIPRSIEFRDTLPETLVGKVLRRVLVEEEKAKVAAG